MTLNSHDSLDAPAQQLLNVLEPDTVLFEVKDGPYAPFQPEDMLP